MTTVCLEGVRFGMVERSLTVPVRTRREVKLQRLDILSEPVKPVPSQPGADWW